jgi:hypothetical protein
VVEFTQPSDPLRLANDETSQMPGGGQSSDRRIVPSARSWPSRPPRCGDAVPGPRSAPGELGRLLSGLLLFTPHGGAKREEVFCGLVEQLAQPVVRRQVVSISKRS